MKTKTILITLFFSISVIYWSCSPNNDLLNNDLPEEEDDEEIVMDLQTQENIADDMLNLYEELLLQNTAEISRGLLVEELKITEYIIDAGISEDATTVWWEYKDGMNFYFLTETALSYQDTSFKSTNNVNKQSLYINNDPIIPENKNALVLSPYDFEFFGHNDTEYISQILDNSGYDVNYVFNNIPLFQNISISDYESFDNYGVIAINTHGGIDKNGELFIASGVPWTEEVATYLKDHKKKGRVDFCSGIHNMGISLIQPVVALKASWFDYVYSTKLSKSLVYIGACKSLKNESLAKALIGNQSAYFGWTENVGYLTSMNAGIDLFTNLSEGETVESAYWQIVENGNNTGVGDPKPYFNMSNNSYDDLALVCGNNETGTFTDARDGKVYSWVKIGEQTWMSENLNYQTANSWWYDNSSANGDIYGRLYTWEAALTACPSGWHLPSNGEVSTLTSYLGVTVAGGKMRETGTAHWESPNMGATNCSGFNGLPGGYYLPNLGDGEESNYLGTHGFWWSSTHSGPDASNLDLQTGNTLVGRYETQKFYGFSVRCIKD